MLKIDIKSSLKVLEQKGQAFGFEIKYETIHQKFNMHFPIFIPKCVKQLKTTFCWHLHIFVRLKICDWQVFPVAQMCCVRLIALKVYSCFEPGVSPVTIYVVKKDKPWEKAGHLEYWSESMNKHWAEPINKFWNALKRK